MKKLQAIDFARMQLKAMNYPCERILSARMISDPDWIRYFSEQCKLPCDQIDVLWEIRFEPNARSETYAESHAIASFVFNPSSGAYGIVR